MWKTTLGIFLTILPLWSSYVRAANFTFSYGAATECDDFEVSWTGGVAPYQLTIISSFGRFTTLNVPDDAYTNNRGTFKATMNHPKGRTVVAIMSDAGGFGTGGVSPVITVGAQTGSTQCNSTEARGEFQFIADQRLVQCGVFPFRGYENGGQLPVSITGFIPGGGVFWVTPDTQDTTFIWKADVAAGTTLGFFVQDSVGRQGGTTDFMQVGQSNDASCLDAQSPASMTNPPSMTSTSSPTETNKIGQPSSQTSPSGRTSSTKDLGSGVIAGIIVGAIIAIAAIGAAIWFCVRHRDAGRFPQRVDLADSEKSDSPTSGLPSHSSVAPYSLSQRPEYAATLGDPASNPLIGRPSKGSGAWSPQTSPSTFEFAQSPSSAASSQFSPTGVRADSSAYGGGSSAYGGMSAYGSNSGHEPSAALSTVSSSSRSGARSSAAQLKAAQAGISAQPALVPRVILHTDIEDELPPPPEEEVIELPPQYSERRRAVQETAPEQQESSHDGPSPSSGSGSASVNATAEVPGVEEKAKLSS
ncbi:hypothetical protein C8Q74DRAFT_404029 [Fomes fomentarius]|nr:hypothetical protein C8Q74DRAFT_404029 [Fomes fomentarius]